MDHDVQYLVLGLHPGAALSEVVEAHRDLAQMWNPEYFTANELIRNIAEFRLRIINEAKDLLLHQSLSELGADECTSTVLDTLHPADSTCQAGRQAIQLFENGQRELAEDLLLTTISLQRGKSSPLLSSLHSQLSVLLSKQDRLEEAAENASYAISIAENQGASLEARKSLARGWYAMGVQCLADKKLEACDSFLSRSKYLMEQSECTLEEIGFTVFQRSLLAGERGDYVEAAELCHEALTRIAADLWSPPQDAVALESSNLLESTDPAESNPPLSAIVAPDHNLNIPCDSVIGAAGNGMAAASDIPFATLASLCARLLLFTLRCLPEGTNFPEATVHQAFRRTADVSRTVKTICSYLPESLRTELLLAVMTTQSQLAGIALNKELRGANEIAADALHFARILYPIDHPHFFEVEQKANAARVRHFAELGIPEQEWPVSFQEILSYASFHWQRVMQHLNEEYPETSLFSPEGFKAWAREASSDNADDREMSECHFTHLSLHFQTEGLVLGQCVADFYLAVIAVREGDIQEALDGFENVLKGCMDELGDESAVTRMCRHVVAFTTREREKTQNVAF